MVKAVIFDMDGVLIDSEPLWAISEEETLREVGISMTEAMMLEVRGLRTDELVEYWFKKYPWKNKSLKEVESLIVVRVTRLIEQKGELLPGAKEAINLCFHQGLPLAVASSSPQKLIDFVINKFSLQSYFKIIHSASDERKGKPDPAVYLSTALKLGVDPKDCLAIEDAPNGVAAAKAAGMKCIAIPQKELINDERIKLADEILASLKDFGLRELS